MKRELYEKLFNIVNGIEDECPEFPDVKDAFVNGELCCKLYGAVYDAERRLEERLGTGEYDTDVETIVTTMEDITKEIGYRMFCYGAKYGVDNKEADG